jgi:hypothetical protein
MSGGLLHTETALRHNPAIESFVHSTSDVRANYRVRGVTIRLLGGRAEAQSGALEDCAHSVPHRYAPLTCARLQCCQAPHLPLPKSDCASLGGIPPRQIDAAQGVGYYWLLQR